MADKGLTFTPVAAGSFPDGYANNLKGGVHVVADTAARDAIADYRLLQGMLVHVLADGCVYRLTALTPSKAWQKVVVAPAASGDDGKVLTVASGAPSWQTLNALPSGGATGLFLGYGSAAEWKSITQVPSSVVGDEGKVLRVNASGVGAFAFPLSKRMNILGSTATNDTATYAVVGSIAFDKSLLDVRAGQNISLRYLLETSNASNPAKVRLFDKTGNAVVGSEQTTTVTSASSPSAYNVHSTLNALASETVLEVQICLTTDASADGSAVATLKAAWIEAV